ncbi:26S proteasome non-ATPase regulatory subunit 10-like isoform X2 [Panicum virgatum]|uniref:26S proteasome non-ATPase regulatory subunit 10-like isoform X2 n=1 Tax=Panicum virgatum TaxID=38727 RepID=UPI0019D66405|nr:26S proteasome non-ATPase regulatory subunit 10-like isoform X2 [Panicum virgatum]
MAPPPPRRPAPTPSAVDAMRGMLLQAAFDGDLVIFKKLAGFLDKGRGRVRETVEAVTVDSDNEEMKGLGVLHLAAGNGKLEMCRHLVEDLLMDVDILDSAGRTPLVSAIYGKSVDAVKYLLEHGANQDKLDRNGFSPLHVAAGLGCCEIVELLLAKGAYTDSVTCCGTPLHIAATEGQDGTMKILLNHNADAGAVANGDYFLTALINAPKNVSAECLNCVLGVGVGSSWNATDNKEPLDKMKMAELKSQGNKAAGRKKFLSAAEFYSMALDLDPEDATLFSNRSLCWLHMGKPLLSLLDAIECRKKRSDWPKACYRQGIALMSLKDYKGACESLLDALKLDPGSSELKDVLRKAMESLKVTRSVKAR